MREPGLLRNTTELKAIVDRRLADVRDGLANARANGETLDVEYFRGQEHELATMQDLLCILTEQPRTGYASTR